MQTWEDIWEILINLLESSLLVFFLEDKLVHSNRIHEKHATSLKIVFVIADTLRTSFLILLISHLKYVIYLVFLFLVHLRLYFMKTVFQKRFSFLARI